MIWKGILYGDKLEIYDTHIINMRWYNLTARVRTMYTGPNYIP